MTERELKAEAGRQGYRLVKQQEYDCQCHMPYPNRTRICRNGYWKCEHHEPVAELCTPYNEFGYDGRTYCRRKK